MTHFIRNDNKNVENQLDFFMANQSEGLTQAGMARLNQSIKALIRLLHFWCTSQCQIFNLGFTRRR